MSHDAPYHESVTLADGSQSKDHGWSELNKDEIDAFNAAYLKEQGRLREAAAGRQETIDLLTNSPGRSATVLTDHSKGLF
jgi:hypothetical protein